MKVETDDRPPAGSTSGGFAEPPQRRSAWARIVLRVLIVFFALTLIAGVVISGIQTRVKARQALEGETKERATRTVSVIPSKSASPVEQIDLPANIQAFTEAPIYARTSGYLKRWYADIGTRGALLAEIDTPELDQQIEQSRSDLRSEGMPVATVQDGNQIAKPTGKEGTK